MLIRRGKKENEILIGLKKNGPMKHFVLPLGGKIKKGETRLTAAFRETKAESRFRVKGGLIVARLHNIFLTPRRKKIVHFVRYRNWEGEFHRCSREFYWLRFVPFSKIPWHRFPRGDVDWMKKVILENKRLFAVTTYERGLKDWIRTRTYPFRT